MSDWRSSRDVLTAIQRAHDALRSGELPVDQAHAAARLLGGAVRLMDTALEHARLTGRLEQGSDALPEFRLAGRRAFGGRMTAASASGPSLTGKPSGPA